MTLRFILRAARGTPVGGEPAPAGDVIAARLASCDGIQVLDRSARMLLVSGSRAGIEAALQGSSGWTLSEETSASLPDPRPRLRGKPPGA